jgi:tetratricopeptide (TPR) repeat protein
VTANHLRCATSFVVPILALLAFSNPSPVLCQTSAHANSATVHGTVWGADGSSLAGATVYLQAQTGTPNLTTRTDAKGAYAFPELAAGTYSIRAEMAGVGEVNSGPFEVGETEARKVDLTLPPGKGPEFFDEPKFTVAGVTDPANSGGHGSDAIRRTSEALAKDTVALSTTPAIGSHSSSDTVAERRMREAVEREPGSFDANRQLGKVLVDEGKAAEALPFLERAARLKPGDYDNTYIRAVAYAGTGQYERARTEIRRLLAQKDVADLRHLLANVDEKLGDPLEAVREYRRAAEMDPSESNLFDWGSELLLHGAIEPAIEVFSKGNRLHPRSARMLMGLAVALYSRGSYEQAAQRLYEASDVNPEDPNPYLFLGRMQSIGSIQSADLVEKLRRFARLQPENALANYYYAVCLWQRRQGTEYGRDLTDVESLLQNAVRLAPRLGPAHLQLGILYADRGDLPKAIAAYRKAEEASPELEDAHFRLARAYERNGDKLGAQRELQLYEELSKKKTEEVERQRHEMRQFVYRLQGPRDGSPQR